MENGATTGSIIHTAMREVYAHMASGFTLHRSISMVLQKRTCLSIIGFRALMLADADRKRNEVAS